MPQRLPSCVPRQSTIETCFGSLPMGGLSWRCRNWRMNMTRRLIYWTTSRLGRPPDDRSADALETPASRFGWHPIFLIGIGNHDGTYFPVDHRPGVVWVHA